MENKESNSQTAIKILILEIFPPLNELTNNNSEIITISFQDKSNDNDIIFNLTDLFINKKELDLSFSSKTSSIKLILNKNDNLYASGQLPLKNGDQWTTLTYDNKKYQNNSNIASTLMDCIKLKIQCKIISGNEMISKVEFIRKNFNIKKKSKPTLKAKNKLGEKKLNLNYLIQDSYSNIDDNKKSNRYIDSNIKTPTPNPYTTINKSNIKKIELSEIKANTKKYNYNYTSLRNENLKNISREVPSNPKIFGKGQKSQEKHRDDTAYLFTEIKTKTKNAKRSLEDINLNLKNKKNKSSIGIKMEISKSNKQMKKRKSDGINKVNLIDKLYDANSNNINYKTNYKENNKINMNKKKSSDNINVVKNLIEKDNLTKSLRTNNIKNKNKNDFINNNKIEEKIDHDIIILNDGDDIENNIFEKQLEDFKLLYSNEYLKSIDNEYLKLEIELFIEKFIELTSLYNKQIEEKYLEYQIEINNYYKNISFYIEINKLFNKLQFIEAHNQLKKNKIKEIKKSHNNNSINNLFLNKKQIDMLKINLFGENLKNKKYKKDIIKTSIKKILGKEKNRKLLEKDEKLKNLLNKCGLYTKEKTKKQK